MVTIAVVTVVRNDLPGLKRTVESLKGQDARVFQHVVVDGASTDGTVEYLASLSPDYAFKYVSEPDGGLYDAMNKSLALADAPVVQFLNAADVLANDEVLSKVASSWESEKWKWAFGGIRYIDDTSTSLGEFLGQPYDRKRIERGLSYVPHQATFALRDYILASGGFREQFGLSADQELLLRLSDEAEPHQIPEILAFMQIGGAHSTSSPMKKAKRYRRIRQNRGTLIAGNSVIDYLFTLAEGSISTARRTVRERLLNRPRF